jgi:acyl carrier protein
MNHQASEIKNTLTSFIKENTFKETENLSDTSMLFKDGYFDSMGFALLVDFLSESFGLDINDEDLIEENFESINAIANYIQSKN